MQLVSAVLKRDTNYFTSMDPFVKLTTPWQTIRSKTAESGGKKPKWNQLIELNVKDTNKMLAIAVYDDDGNKSELVSLCFYRVTCENFSV